MRKRVLASILIFILMISLSFVIAQDDETTTDQEKVDEAYSCLREKIDDRTCSELSLEEKIFSLLAVNKCKSEIQDSKDADDCWPDGNCNIKSTAQAILALDSVNADTDDAEAWLLSQEAIPREMNWYVQIESDGETTCTIYYDEGEYSVSIGEDKKINTVRAGQCLSRSSNGYWLKVSSIEQQECYDKEFEISCDRDFLTSLLFQKTGSSTIHVSETTTSAAAGGATSEKVDSFCFSTSIGSCNYEGSLWATLVLDLVGEEISSYLPYLITMAEESTNKRYLPEAFLYFLTADTTYRTILLDKQKLNKYWLESGDKFYDTALALYPFQYEEPQKKIDSKEWLLEEGIQDRDGCWEGNIRNTAFLLYSIWPEGVLPDGDGVVDGVPDCVQAGYYCRSRLSCVGDLGSVLDTYTCSSPFVCCDTPESEGTCFEIGGEICDSTEECVGGIEEITSDLGYREICCVGGGICREKIAPVLSDCELIGGTCRDLDCYDDEEISSEDCDYSGEVCCIEKTTTEKSTFWIWILLVLIVLVVFGIIFKDKLRRFWFRAKGGGRKPRPRPRPGYPPAPLTGHPERMPMPRGPPPRIPARRPRGEMADVLKKLKEMGK